MNSELHSLAHKSLIPKALISDGRIAPMPKNQSKRSIAFCTPCHHRAGIGWIDCVPDSIRQSQAWLAGRHCHDLPAWGESTRLNPSPPPLSPSYLSTQAANNTPTSLPTQIPDLPTATVAPTATAQPSPTPIPGKVELPTPLWEQQGANNCGPATLAIYLHYYGWEGNQENITQVVKPLEEDRNVNPEELVYFIRTHAGWLNAEFRVGGDLVLIKQLVAAGFPVMIEESFYFDTPYWPNDDLWAAHYLLITGYDDSAQTFIGQDSFHGPNQVIAYTMLDSYWQIFNRVYLLVYPPAQEGALKSILGDNWDPDLNRQHALEVSQAETQSTPNNALYLVQPGQ